MQTVKAFLAVALMAAVGCRSTASNPGDEDSGFVVDSGGPMDSGVGPMDTGGGSDRACVVTGMENTNATCGDGLDNDCNGFRDCNDFSCSRNNPAVTICGDAGGTRVDRGPCVPTGMENTNATCGDRVDNDCDGFVDCNDFNCSRTAAVTVCGDGGGATADRGPCTPTGMENTNALCGDRIDNDCDGFVDCNDFNCSRTAAVTVCGDGGVRDASTPIDSGPRDSGNTRDVTRLDTRGCDSGGARENTAAACTDGVDNDCDGFLDCHDRDCSCQASCGPYALACTCSGAETTNATCGDGMDNDCNGFLDCGDFSCSMNNPAVTVCMDAGRRD